MSGGAPGPARLFLLCGLAFSGKTTLARAIARRLPLAYLSLDEINTERGLRPGGEGLPGEAWEGSHAVAEARLAAALESGRSAILDDTGCFRWLRDRYRELARRHGCHTVVIFVDTPVEELRARITNNARTSNRSSITDEVFTRHVAEFEPPGPDEDTVIFTPSDDIEAWITAHLGVA